MTRRIAAFTLIEMLVVILLIAIMASVLVPNYSRFAERNRFQFVLRMVQDKFAEAREKAVENATTSSLVFNPQAESFMVSVTPQPPSADQPVALSTDAVANDAASAMLPDQSPIALGETVNVASFTVGDSQGASAGSNLKTVRFRPDGTCNGAMLTLVSRSGYAAQITVLPATGRAVVEDAPLQP